MGKTINSEKKWIISIWDSRRTLFNISDFAKLNNATDRGLFVLATSTIRCLRWKFVT